MASLKDHELSDTDSDITIGPDDNEIKASAKCSPSPVKQSSLNKRRSQVHEIWDSEEESEEFFILKGKTKGKGTKPSPKLESKINSSTSVKPSTSTLSKSVYKTADFVTKSPVKKNKSFTEVKNWLDKLDSSDEEIIPKKDKSDSAKKLPSKENLVRSESKTLKRKQTEILDISNETPHKRKPPCPYGSKCYRKNPSHFEEYSHLSISVKKENSSVERRREESPPRKRQKTRTLSARSVDQVYSDGQPYSFFLTKVQGLKDQYNWVLSMDIKDILSPIMGTIKSSCQFNYMFEIPWLMKQYPEQFRSKPLLLVHGFTGGNKSALEIEASKFSNIKFCQARLEMIYGTHHTKMMLLLYDEGMRVVIHTSNLIERDWFQKTQGMWISPLFPKLKKVEGKNNYTQGESPTNFKKDLLEYIASYKAYQLREWQDNIADHDMSSANVFIIGSSPGRHMGDNKHKFGHMKLRRVLNSHGPPKDQVKTWPVVGQYSSIGSLGATREAWLATEFLQSLATVNGSSVVPLASINLKLIFPTKDNVRCSLEGYPAGASIPYSINVAKKQSYLHSYFHHWKSDGRGRSRAMPHIKTYCRPAPSSDEMAWFLVTSANLSKAAWGALEKKGAQLMIRSYEIGVLFLPKFFGNKMTFPVTSDIEDFGKFMLPYDLPLKSYQKEDRPWIWDIPYKDLPDSNGNMWCPS